MILDRVDGPITVNVSGGRTSAFGSVEFDVLTGGRPAVRVFSDTGCEHPLTYDYLRALDGFIGHRILCLQGDFNQPLKTGHSVNVVDIDSLKWDPVNGPFGQILRKYGVPTVGSAWCTTRMKEETHRKYFDKLYGRGEYYTFIGIRADEPARLVGANYVHRAESCYHLLQAHGYNDFEITQLFRSVRLNPKSIPNISAPEVAKALLARRVNKVISDKVVHLGEISDADEDDVMDFWADSPIDLSIDKHLGNCVFCIKKSLAKLALAFRDEPHLLAGWQEALSLANPRLNKGSKYVMGTMYREKNTVDSIIAKFSLVETEDLRKRCRTVKGVVQDASGCSESCEGFTQ